MGEKRFEDIGIDYEKGLSIFMGNEEMYLSYLKDFLYNGSYEEIIMGVEIGDFSMAENSALTLKGVAANLGMTGLTNVLDDLIKALEEKDSSTVYEVMNRFQEAYSQLMAIHDERTK